MKIKFWILKIKNYVETILRKTANFQENSRKVQKRGPENIALESLESKEESEGFYLGLEGFEQEIAEFELV